MWEILYLMLRAPTTAAPLNEAAFPAVMSRLATDVAGHPRPIVRLLASTCFIVIIVAPGSLSYGP